MILGSHNSWSYLTPVKWWMKMLKWTGKCQSTSIYSQLLFGVKCFDLRVRFENGRFIVAHNLIKYNITMLEVFDHLSDINDFGNCYVRILHEVRDRKQYNSGDTSLFKAFCKRVQGTYKNINFFGGNNLIDGNLDYNFDTKEPSIEGSYGSQRKPHTIYALWPWLYAKRYNKEEYQKDTDKDIKLMDFIQIGYEKAL